MKTKHVYTRTPDMPGRILYIKVSCLVLVLGQETFLESTVLHTRMIRGLIPGIGTVPHHFLADYELAQAKSSPGTILTTQIIYSAHGDSLFDFTTVVIARMA